MIKDLLFVLTSEPLRIGTTIGAALLIGGTLRLMDYTIRNVITWLIVGAIYIFFQFWIKASLGFYVSNELAEAATAVSAIGYFAGITFGNLIVSRYSKLNIGLPLRDISPEMARRELKRSGSKEKTK